MRSRIAIAVIACALGACRGKSDDADSRPVSVPPAAGSGSGSARVAVKPTAPAPVPTPEPPLDANRQIAELGAIPAWQAVVDRAQLLARRGQKGVVYGRIGPVIPPAEPTAPAATAPSPGDAGIPADAGVPADAGSSADAGAPADAGIPVDAAVPAAAPPPAYVWLVDDTEGNGSLGIRVALGRHAAKPGDRVAIAGAWELDEARRWFWRAAGIQQLAAPPASDTTVASKDPPAAVPSHVPASAPFPPGTRPIKLAKDNDIVYFQLMGPIPARDGDGWLVGDELKNGPSALLILPGERPSYGAQDMRSRDERWQLKHKQLYWLRIGKVRPQGPGKPFAVNARTAPVRAI